MISLAVNSYMEDAIISQLHASTGNRDTKIRYELLNYNNIKIGEVSAISGKVGLNSLAEIKRTGSFTLKDSDTKDIDWLNDRIRPVFCLRMPDSGFAEWSLGIFLLSSPRRQEINLKIQRDVEAYGQSLILREDKYDTRYRIVAGSKYTTAITGIINSAGISRVNLPDHPGTLAVDKEFEIGTPKLIAINELLAAINYSSLWVDESGYFVAQPYKLPSERESEYAYKNDRFSVIHNGAAEDVDLFNVPNKWVVVASNPENEPLVGRYINNNPASMTSTYNRHRVITDYREVKDIFDQETLDNYTKRIAYNASDIYGTLEFTTALMPHHSFLDCLFVEHTDLGVSAKYIETSWEMDLTAGIMRHSARRVIHI